MINVHFNRPKLIFLKLAKKYFLEVRTMGYFGLLFALGLFTTVQAHDIGEVVLYAEKNFQGFSQAYSFVAMGCVGYGIGFPSVLNVSIGSLKADHKIVVMPMQACMGQVAVTLEAGSYPDIPSTLIQQEPLFQTVMKSFFMLPFQQDNIQLYSRPGPQGQNPILLSTVLVEDIGRSSPCYKFNDSMSTLIGGVNNHLHCVVFFTGKECQGLSFEVGAQENQVSLEVYQPSETYYGIKLCGTHDGSNREQVEVNLKALYASSNKSSVSDQKAVGISNNAWKGKYYLQFISVFITFLGHFSFKCWLGEM